MHATESRAASMQQLQLSKSGHESMEIGNIRDRIALINQGSGTDMPFEIEDILPEQHGSTGTIVRVYFPRLET